MAQWLPHHTSDGPGHMALDEFLLLRATTVDHFSSAGAALRTYDWQVPTLSLGYFQSLAEARADPRWNAVPLVRRTTGGGAIWHHHEMTYAIALPRSHPLARRPTDLYRAVHSSIARSLQSLGIPAERRGEASARQTRQRPLLCFQDRDAEDIVVGGSKVLGSAQRRRAGALLLHGSLLLRRSEFLPELPGLADLFEGLSDSPAEWSSRLIEPIASAIGLELRPAEIHDTEQLQVDQIETDIYRNPTWTNRRE